MAFRLIPREEKFYDDFSALADEIKRGAGLLEEMLAPDQPDLGQGRRDQGSRAQVRLPDARDHPAAQPHLRHAARPRRHPRAGALARRRDGRDRRVGDARPALPARHASGSARASWPQIIIASRRAGRAARSTRSSSSKGVAEPRGRDQPPRERGRPRPPGRRSASCSTKSATRSSIMKWKEIARLPRRCHRPLRGRRQRPRRRRRQARLSRWMLPAGRRRPDRRRARLRLHQRLPRRRQLDRDGRLDARAVAGQGGHLGGVLQLRRRVHLRHRGREDRRLGHGRHQDRHLRGDLRRPDRRDRLGPDHLVLRPADQLVARADRRLRRRGGRQGRLRARSSRRAGRKTLIFIVARRR